jgi:TadE-like protein
MPVFLAIWMGIVEYCWLAYNYTSLNEAVAIGCRAASLVDPGVDEVDAAAVISTAKTEMVEAFEDRGPGCTGTCNKSAALVNARPNRSVACGMTASYLSITGFVPTPTTLSTRSVVRLEFQRGGS